MSAFNAKKSLPSLRTFFLTYKAACSLLRKLMATSAPAWANKIAVALPIPREPPVIKAFLPSKQIIFPPKFQAFFLSQTFEAANKGTFPFCVSILFYMLLFHQILRAP
jgi:hypothetical protein